MTGFAVGAALIVIGLSNQGHSVNGATLLWVVGLIVATVALMRSGERPIPDLLAGDDPVLTGDPPELE
jgi:hypothetical protein